MTWIQKIKNWFKKDHLTTPSIIQMEAVECGAASLGIILGYYGRFVSLEVLRDACGVTKDGSSAANLLDAAEQFGLHGEGYRCDVEELKDLELPAILFWHFNHFLVLEGYSDKWVYLNDPAEGRRKTSWEELEKDFSNIALTFSPTKDFKKEGHEAALWPLIKERLQHSKLAVIFLFSIGLLLLIPSLFVPIFNQIFYDNILAQHQTHWIWGLAVALLAAAFIAGLLTWVQNIGLTRLYQRLVIISSSQFFWRLLRLPILFFSQRYSGEISYRFHINTELMNTLSSDLPQTVINLCLIIFYLFFIFYYSVQIGILAVITGLISLFLLWTVMRARTDAFSIYQQQYMKGVGFAVASLKSLENLKAAGNEGDAFARWVGYFALQINASNQINKKDVFTLSVPTLVQGISSAVLIGVGAWQVMEGSLALGALIALQGFFSQFLSPINEMLFLGNTLQTLKVYATRIDDAQKAPLDPIFTRDSSITDVQQRTHARLLGSLELKNIQFGYSKLDPPILDELTLSVKPGQHVAIIGRSSSGKSTLLKLIGGLYQPWQGAILFDGEPRENYPPNFLQKSVAFIDQQFFFFQGSITDNLTLWDSTVPEEVILNATKDACIHDDIMQRPLGYDTQLSEGGRNFSGGQRQRLEIARALLLEPTILIVDSATSALDAHVEQQIVTNLRRRGCTILIVAHRISTIQHADQILVLDQGKIIDAGTHEELKGRNGFYKEWVVHEQLLLGD